MTDSARNGPSSPSKLVNTAHLPLTCPRPRLAPTLICLGKHMMRSWPESAELAQFGSKSSPTLPKLGRVCRQSWANNDQIRSRSVEIGLSRCSVKIEHIWGKIRPEVARFGQYLSTLGRDWSQSNHLLRKSGSDLTNFRITLANSGRIGYQIWLTFATWVGQLRPKTKIFGRTIADRWRARKLHIRVRCTGSTWVTLGRHVSRTRGGA